jgi:hypothetical protein
LSCLIPPPSGAVTALRCPTPTAASGDGCFVVGPQYYLTGRPRQGYTFKSPDLFPRAKPAARGCGQENCPSSLRIWRS